jgi:hypothetical protein
LSVNGNKCTTLLGGEAFDASQLRYSKIVILTVGPATTMLASSSDAC